MYVPIALYQINNIETFTILSNSTDWDFRAKILKRTVK